MRRLMRWRYAPWVAGVAVWTALPLLFVTQTAIWLTYRGQPVEWSEMIVFRVADWYTCGVFVPLLVWATRRWPVERRPLAARLALHLALVVAVSAAKIVLFEPVRALIGVPGPGLARAFAGSFISEIVAFGATATAIHALEFYRLYRDREQLSEQLQARLSDAQLRALRAQLNPHFLFNTLNAVTTLVHRDPHRADAMLTRLGELLRLTLRADPDHEIPLLDEMAQLELYLEIMRMRFPDRVTVGTSVHPDVAHALVPSFVLQPLVENAFEHGVAQVVGAASVDVAAVPSRDGKSVVLRVRDDGPGLVHTYRTGGLGIGTTRQRLQEMYGSDASLQLTTPPDGGTLVEVRIPYRPGVAPTVPAGSLAVAHA
jgi:two-component system LytT family sensor kinase